jgi:hypothetical protein
MKQILFKLFENLKQLGIKPNIGSRTNVTPIPGSEIDRLINRKVTPKEFDYSKPEVVDSMKSIVQNASDYVGQFTERQLKTFNDNVERIIGAVKPKETTAEVVDLATKEKITGPGLESLMREKGVAPISRKTIEAETLIKQFLDDDLISLNAKQIDQLSRGRAEDVFENIFGSKAKELITGKNTNESLNEVYNKLKTTKDTRGRLPDDPNFDPSDINFRDGGSVSEDVKKLLKEEFIELINADPESFPDTNAGFRRFLKRKGSPVFNYKDGGEVKESKQTDAEMEEEIRENKKELLNKKSILNLYKGNTLFGLDLDFADKNIGGEFGQYNKKDIKDPRIGLSIIPNVQDDTSSRLGISIGPKGGGITFMKPFSGELIDEENMSSKMTDEELIQNYINFAKNVWGTKVTEDEARKTLGIYKIPDTNVRDLIIPKMKKGGKVKEKAEEPLSNYESYSENELLSSLDAKMPNLEIIEDELITMPMFEGKDIVPKGSRPVMPSEEYFRQRLFLDLAKGGRVKKRKRYADGGTYPTSVNAPNGIQYELIYSPFSGKPLYRPKYDPSRSDLNYYGTDPEEFFKTIMSTGTSTPTTTEIPSTGFFSGPAYDTYSQARSDAYANSPNKFTYDVTANQAAGQFAQDKLKELLGDNILSQTLGTIGTVAAVPLAFYSSPFHEAAQVINEGRMEPGSGVKGFYDAFMNELPLSTAANRAAGVLKSIPGIGESIYSGAYNLGESLANLKSNISNPTIQRTVNVGSYDPGVQTLGASIGNLDYSTMNALRNNADLLNTITGQTANMANGGLTKTIPPVRGPNPQGVESLFKKRYN